MEAMWFEMECRLSKRCESSFVICALADLAAGAEAADSGSDSDVTNCAVVLVTGASGRCSPERGGDGELVAEL